LYPLWREIIEPALRAAAAERVVEIGAFRGETTVKLLELLGPEAELHVIDPAPMFDPSEHARRFAGRYVFHRDISHNVLPELPSCDAALVDGDHNWFTVYHELKMLQETARKAGSPMPLLILHDVCWPYGRRDLYYAPDRIPEEFRQPHQPRGILPGERELVDDGGLNPTLENAVVEGGPRNGVMTALEDFATEHEGPLRLVVIPIYHGLALVAEQQLLDARPQLDAFLDYLETAEAHSKLVELAESLRLEEQLQHHSLRFSRQARAERGVRRYLDLLKGALLDEHYLENELRIDYLLRCIAAGRDVDAVKLRDPARYLVTDLRHVEQQRRTGEIASQSPAPNSLGLSLAYTGVGRIRLDHLERCLETIRVEEIAGDLVECGAGRGGTAIFLRGFLEAWEFSGRKVWVADRFDGAATEDDDGTSAFPPDLNTVRDAFARFGLLDSRVAFLQGPPFRTLGEAPIGRVALLRVDGSDPEEIRATLEALYDSVTPGGFVVIDDYSAPGCREMVDRFRSERGAAEELERIDWSGAVWRRAAETVSAEHASVEVEVEAGEPTATRDLSVVVVFYNMRREAARTLHSLSRGYQQGVDDLDYEVIVVDNGSEPEQRLGEEFVRSFGAEFRYIELGDDATPSPARALNVGVAASTGRSVATMVDGAHVLTPGVLRFGMLGLASYAPAVVTTQQWYVGPGQQSETVPSGYGRELEDRLFEQIEWPTDGYRLFDIGHFIGDRDWFDSQWESNCIFVPRSLLEQAGAMDESFATAGGGYVNLDFFERVGSSPSITLVTILGEGSFHQVHGGTTTNVPDMIERRKLLARYGEDYAELRGRRFRAPTKPIHYVGSLAGSARRTKARRMTSPEYFKAAQLTATDGRPVEPMPVPEELRTEFTEAFWGSSEWHRTTWLGRGTHKAPTDLLAYQDLVFRARPEWIIETRTGAGGRALFLASICDLVGRGQVLSIDDHPIEDLAEHPRIRYVRGDPATASIADEVRGVVGDRTHALVILGAAARDKVLAAFENYAPLVPVGSYLVVEDTILNGHPVWPGFGRGPAEAVQVIINAGEFAPDPALERYALTFNPGGFLQRIR
jgi:cephalosporin hydroxylase